MKVTLSESGSSCWWGKKITTHYVHSMPLLILPLICDWQLQAGEGPDYLCRAYEGHRIFWSKWLWPMNRTRTWEIIPLSLLVRAGQHFSLSEAPVLHYISRIYLVTKLLATLWTCISLGLMILWNNKDRKEFVRIYLGLFRYLNGLLDAYKD